jgi:hypothetical protein
MCHVHQKLSGHVRASIYDWDPEDYHAEAWWKPPRLREIFLQCQKLYPVHQDIKIINAFHDGVSDVKIVEEIAIKKPKIVAVLLVVADTCIEAVEAWA